MRRPAPSFYGTKGRTLEQIRATLSMRLTMARSVDDLSVAELARSSRLKPAEIAQMLEAEKRRRAGHG